MIIKDTVYNIEIEVNDPLNHIKLSTTEQHSTESITFCKNNWKEIKESIDKMVEIIENKEGNFKSIRSN